MPHRIQAKDSSDTMLWRKPVPKFVGALNEQQDIVADAQMDVVDALVDETDAVVAALRHPERDISLRHPFAPADDEGLAEPVLSHAGQDRARS